MNRREVEFLEDELGRHAVFADTSGQRYRDAGRGDTDEEAVEDLKRKDNEK